MITSMRTFFKSNRTQSCNHNPSRLKNGYNNNKISMKEDSNNLMPMTSTTMVMDKRKISQTIKMRRILMKTPKAQIKVQILGRSKVKRSVKVLTN